MNLVRILKFDSWVMGKFVEFELQILEIYPFFSNRSFNFYYVYIGCVHASAFVIVILNFRAVHYCLEC